MPDATDLRIHGPAPAGWWHVSRTGLLFGAAYFLISMAPSLLPRTWYYQGLISGLCAAVGYGLGVFVAWLVRTVARLIDLRVTVERRGAALARSSRRRSSAGSPSLGLTVANVRSQARTAAVVAAGARSSPLDWALALALAAARRRALPRASRGGCAARRTGWREAAGHVAARRRSRRSIAVVVVALATAWVSDSVRLPPGHAGLRRHRGTGQLAPARRARGPTSPLRSGGPGSLESYDSLGYQGQMFVTSAPTPAQITAATERGAIEPIRVYAGRTPDAVGGRGRRRRRRRARAHQRLQPPGARRLHDDGHRLGRRLVGPVDRVPQQRRQRHRRDAVLLPAERACR